jgi:hypothetical protein
VDGIDGNAGCAGLGLPKRHGTQRFQQPVWKTLWKYFAELARNARFVMCP